MCRQSKAAWKETNNPWFRIHKASQGKSVTGKEHDKPQPGPSGLQKLLWWKNGVAMDNPLIFCSFFIFWLTLNQQPIIIHLNQTVLHLQVRKKLIFSVHFVMIKWPFYIYFLQVYFLVSKPHLNCILSYVIRMFNLSFLSGSLSFPVSSSKLNLNCINSYGNLVITVNEFTIS
jgi:hypothetical protein